MFEFFRIIKNILCYRKIFKDVKTYCFFIGQPRSGHTLVRAMLDAHPHMVFSNEFDVFRFLKKRKKISRVLLFSRILARSYEQARCGNRWTGYEYGIENLYQGEHTELEVIGDKKGVVSARSIAEGGKEIVEALKQTVRVPIKVIHVIRNPYDTIATISNRSNRSLSGSTVAYFDDVKNVLICKDLLEEFDICEIYHEDLIENPEKVIKKLCVFLGQEASQEYVNICKKIIYKNPNKSRFSVLWEDGLIENVKKSCHKVDFLEDYTYDT